MDGNSTTPCQKARVMPIVAMIDMCRTVTCRPPKTRVEMQRVAIGRTTSGPQGIMTRGKPMRPRHVEVSRDLCVLKEYQGRIFGARQ